MRKLLKVLLLLVAGSGLLLLLFARSDTARLLAPGLHAKYGNFAGGPRSASKSEPFRPKATLWGIRWFPTHVHFGPDNDTLLVSLCHVSRPEFCRIGKYQISADRWDILPFDENRTYNKPIFSPDGQWIVYSGAPCDREAQCDVRGYQLFKTTPDGTRTELLADTVALYPSFAADGRKLIYWRWNIVVKPDGQRFPGGMNLYQLDWATGQETALTKLTLMPGEQWGKPFFLPDGERFIFMIRPDVFTFAGASPGAYYSAAFLIGSMKDVPITDKNYRTLEVVRKDSGMSYPCDIDRTGRILYTGWGLLEKKRAGNRAALSIRPADSNYGQKSSLTYEENRRKYPFHKLTDEQLRSGDGAILALQEQIDSDAARRGDGSALFLRKLEASVQDEAAFDIAGCTEADSVSQDGTHQAFIWGGSLPSNRHAVAILEQGKNLDHVRLVLNWPKLDLHLASPIQR